MAHFESCDQVDCSCESTRYVQLFWVSFGLIGLQLAGGVVARSLPLMTDAYHHLTDGAGYALSLAVAALIRRQMASRPATVRSLTEKTITILLGVGGVLIIREAFERWSVGATSRYGLLVVVLALIGAGGNWFQYRVLRGGHHAAESQGLEHWNRRHVVFDLIQNVAVVGTGIANDLRVDTAISVAIGSRMLWEVAAGFFGKEHHH
mgnify:CR=1 FL=1